MPLSRRRLAKTPEDARGEIEKIFDSFLVSNSSLAMFAPNVWRPPTDVYETDAEIVVKIAISGVRPEDIHVKFQDNILTVAGIRNDSSPHRKTAMHQMEINYGPFERRIYMPKPIDEAATRATYKDGYLVINIPKCEPHPRSVISIKITM